MKFSAINFKYTDALEEQVYAPEILENAFVDINSITTKIFEPENFIVSGSKGAGKTAISSKLLLEAKARWNLFVEVDELENFQFRLLEKTGGSKGTSIGGAVSVWQLLLLLRLIALLSTDNELTARNPAFYEFHKKLVDLGLVPSHSLVQIVQTTSRRGAYAQIKSAVAEVRAESGESSDARIKDPAAATDAIKHVLTEISPSENHYFLMIDGLDYPIREERSNAYYIADLISAVRGINHFMRDRGFLAKCVLLVRDEVLQLIPDPNLAKRINDNGVALDWYDNVRSPLDTALLQVIAKRAKLVGFTDDIRVLWSSWFPPDVDGRPTVSFILDNTRFLPRDLISVFRFLQDLHKEPPFAREDILAALNNYSNWFLQELSDSLVGLVPEPVRASVPDVLSELGRKSGYEDFAKVLERRGLVKDMAAEQIAKELFSTSWIGNVWKTQQGSLRFSWRHRKRTATFNATKELLVHSGLWKALNLV